MKNESNIDTILCEKVRRRGGMTVKLETDFVAGLPDRLVILPGGKMLLAEIKRPGGRPRLLQEAAHQHLRRLGVSVYVVDSAEAIEDLLRGI